MDLAILWHTHRQSEISFVILNAIGSPASASAEPAPTTEKSAVESVRNHDSSKQNYLSMLNSFLSRPSGKNEQLGKRLSKTLSQSPSLRIRGRTVNNSAKRNFVNALQCNNKPLPSVRPSVRSSFRLLVPLPRNKKLWQRHPHIHGAMMVPWLRMMVSNTRVTYQPTNHPCVPVDLSETDWWWWCHSCCFAGHCWNPVGVWDEDGP